MVPSVVVIRRRRPARHFACDEYLSMGLSSQRSRMVIDTPAEMVEQVSSGRIVHAGSSVASR